MKFVVAVLALLPICAQAQDVMCSPPHCPLINGIAPPYQLPGAGFDCWKDIRSLAPAKFGETVVSYKVATDGSVKDLTLEQSSGSDGLDRKIMKCSAAARFKPATKNGRAVEYPEKIDFDWSWKP